jgi:hypothetical protein
VVCLMCYSLVAVVVLGLMVGMVAVVLAHL